MAIKIVPIKKKNADVAKWLCNQRDRHGTLPLFLAIQEGHNQVAKAIVQVYGPEDLKALRGNEFAGDDGMRVMDCAVLADNAEMVEYLIRSGWDISDERTWGGPCGPNGRRLSPLIKAEANGKRKASQKLQEIELSRERQKEKRGEVIYNRLRDVSRVTGENGMPDPEFFHFLPSNPAASVRAAKTAQQTEKLYLCNSFTICPYASGIYPNRS